MNVCGDAQRVEDNLLKNNFYTMRTFFSVCVCVCVCVCVYQVCWAVVGRLQDGGWG